MTTQLSRKEIDKIYCESRKQEKDLWKKLRKGLRKKYQVVEPKRAQILADYICRALCTLRVREIVWVSERCHDTFVGKAAGVWEDRKLHFISRSTDLMTFCHEMGHHVQHCERIYRFIPSEAHSHGEDFLWAERVVWDTILLWISEQEAEEEKAFLFFANKR